MVPVLTELLRFGGNCHSFDLFRLFQYIPGTAVHSYSLSYNTFILHHSPRREAFSKNVYRYGVGFWFRYTIVLLSGLKIIVLFFTEWTRSPK
jgi:hypothetical protein